MISTLDWQAFSLINSLAGHWALLDAAMAALARYGVALFVLPLAYLWLAGPAPQRAVQRQLVLRAVLAAALALLANAAIGLAYFRPRPFVSHRVRLLAAPVRDASFPSDHAAGSFALTAGVWRGPAWVRIYTLVLSLLICLARVYVGLHYPLDVVGGAAVGIVAAVLVERAWPLLLNSPAGRVVGLATRLP